MPAALNFLGALRVTKAVLSGFRERGAAGSCRVSRRSAGQASSRHY